MTENSTMTLGDLITEFQVQVARHAALVTDENDDEVLVAATYWPTLAALNDPPMARTPQEATMALQLILEHG